MAVNAVTTVDPSSIQPIEVNLDNWPADRFNRLIPTQTLQMPSDLIVPVFQVVQLTDRETYHSNDMPAGHKAPNRVGLDRLASTAGVNFIGETRLDDGSKPGVCGVQVEAEMLLPTGQRLRATGTRWIDMNAMSWSSPAQRGKFAGFLYEHTATRARNRAIRALLSLHSSYPDAELRKPFAVVSFVPNMNHPDIRSRILDSLTPAIAASFGPETKQIGPGEVQQVPEAPEEDVTEGSFTEAARQEPAAAAEPSWFDALPTEKPAAAAAAATPKLIEVLREKAAKSGLQGDITDPQKGQVAAAFGTEISLELIATGLAEVFGTTLERDDHGRPKLRLSAAQAQAVIDAARDDEFKLNWQEAFGGKAAAA